VSSLCLGRRPVDVQSTVLYRLRLLMLPTLLSHDDWTFWLVSLVRLYSYPLLSPVIWKRACLAFLGVRIWERLSRRMMMLVYRFGFPGL